MKKTLTRAVSATERTRIWLLNQRWFQSRLMPALPRQLRWFLHKLYLAPVDLADRILGRDQGLPPKSVNFSGDRVLHDFAARGESFVRALVETTDLTPSSQVLDLGCGPGRLAIAMTTFLNSDGHYDGLDIIPEAINWCKENIGAKHPNVDFTLADVYNKEYNPAGRVTAADYRFPWNDATFDVIVLVSVFTHLLPADFENYVSEISRVLKNDGKVFATYYLITPDSLKQMKSSGRAMQFTRNMGTHWLQNGRVPELAVGYDETYMEKVYRAHGFDDLRIYLGAWCGRTGHWPMESGIGGQDTVVAAKLH
jgi:SAM-dependent methyltransferase